MTTTPPKNDPMLELTWSERERQAKLLSTLSQSQWDVDSLCAGWSVREVVAHLTMPFRTSIPRLLAGVIRARFSFDRYADRDARQTVASLSEEELLEVFEANITHPWQPPGGGAVGALSHQVIHGLDITEPLGLPAPDPSVVAVVLSHAAQRNVDTFGVDLTGVTLVADDAEVRVGAGAGVLTMPAKDVLLVVTGRKNLQGERN